MITKTGEAPTEPVSSSAWPADTRTADTHHLPDASATESRVWPPREHVGAPGRSTGRKLPHFTVSDTYTQLSPERQS